jgi:argininosuccinate lyase
MLREGRLGKSVDAEFARYTSSLAFDRNILEYDILGSMAHALMLGRRGIIQEEEMKRILAGLLKIYRSRSVSLDHALEDVHVAVEARLFEEIGETAGKLHTARSRNDQVALDLRMLARDRINRISRALLALEEVLLKISGENKETPMPGYTHLQRAQPTTLAHHMLAHFWSFARDLERLEDAYRRVNLSPLGACALAGTSFPIDRTEVARLLGFSGIVENSQDAVASRDFLLEPLSALAILAVNLSRLAEELILWSTAEFGFVELSDELSSTSSIMPQKKNPDALEIMRARVARAIGNLTSAFALVKALPLAYNRDLQELSPVALDSFEILEASVSMLSRILSTAEFKHERMRATCEGDFLTATELADYLVREKGLAFRTAHRIVGRLVAGAVKAGISPDKITPEMLDDAALEVIGKPLGLSKEELECCLSLEKSIAGKRSTGAPSPPAVEESISRGEAKLAEFRARLEDRERKVKEAFEALLKEVERLAG